MAIGVVCCVEKSRAKAPSRSATEIRWNKYKVSLGSFERLLSRRPSSERNDDVIVGIIIIVINDDNSDKEKYWKQAVPWPCVFCCRRQVGLVNVFIAVNHTPVILCS